MFAQTSKLLLLGCCLATLSFSGCRSTQPTKAEAKPADQAPTRRAGWPRNATDANMTWVAMAYPTGDPRTSALGIEKGVPRSARLNQATEYMIVVTNLSDLALDNVVVTDDISDNFKVSKTNPEGRAGANGMMTWALGNMRPNESKTITVTGSPTKEADVTSCAAATYSSSLCTAFPVVSPKLMITKTGPAQVLKCEEIAYNIEVTNTGTGSIPGVKVVDALPAGLLTADNKNSVEYAVGTLEAGQKRTLTTRVHAEKAGKYENKATATGGGLTAESGSVVTTVVEPELKITKKCPPNEFIGHHLDFEITVTNTGTGICRDTVIEDIIPNGATFVSASDGGRPVGGKTVWQLGTLDPKASKTVKVTLVANTAGSYGGVAVARGYCAAPVNASCAAQVTGIPAILLEVVDIEDPSPVGSNDTYVITVTNQGSAPGTNIKIVATLEPNQTYVSSQGPTTGSASGNTITFAPIASLAPKDKAVFRVTVKNVKAGDVRFKTVMTSDQLTRPVEETEATNVYE